ncbi:hypothetical protein EXE10_14150 [Acinetobacter sp. WCHAc060033]|uniref:hypothetical protein n=1 Tax=Acinetobacter sp. WCHAc060033 TaxID=2518624 RepID=UPI001023744B|nr:hypothetical protein [Acinetobacter sp. WCHAc060033]RZG80455.1 hypothetical protein EXE10_14150 [Acinetobacter sp. WCHAc060033]
MGHYSTLWIAKDKETYNEETDEYLEVKYAIPLFWIALFTVEDITTLKDEDDSTYYTFSASVLKACDTFKSRLNIWSTLYNNDKAEVLAKLFLAYFERIPTFNVELNVTDIMGMSIDPFSEEAKECMIDMVHFIDEKQKNPNYISPSKMWLPTNFKLEVPKDRYLDIDGFGEELLPYPELDQWLKQNEKAKLEIKPVKSPSKKRLYISIVIMIIFTFIYFYK